MIEFGGEPPRSGANEKGQGRPGVLLAAQSLPWAELVQRSADVGVKFPVDAKSPRWHRVTPSTFPWEDEAIEFLRARIADADPNRAWSNLEFISGGTISEVDVFLLTLKGAFLIEIKSTPGRLKTSAGRRPPTITGAPALIASMVRASRSWRSSAEASTAGAAASGVSLISAS